MGAQHITDADFEAEVLKSDKPVLVDFYADWCGPCRSLLPTIETLATEQADKIKVVKVNVDNSPETPGRYGVRSIPALFIFKDGKAVSNKNGTLAKSALEQWIADSI